MLNKALPSMMTAVNWRAEEASNVHSQLSAKQWGNSPYHLGYTSENLGAYPEALTVVFNNNPQVISQSAQLNFDTNYTKELLIEAFQSYYKNLGEEDRRTLFQPLLDSYQEAILAGQAPLLDDKKNLKALYTELSAAAKASDWHLLKSLYSKFQAQDIQPSYQIISWRQKLSNDVDNKDWGSFISSSLRRDINRGSLDTLIPRLEEAVIKAQEDNDLLPGEPEKKEALIVEMQHWIATFAQSEQKDKEFAFQRSQIDQALSMSTCYEERLAMANVQLLSQKLAIGNKLKPLGLELWLTSAKLNKPAIDETQPLSNQEKLLVWASNLPVFKAELLIPRLDDSPKLYLLLADADKGRPEVLAKVATNPGLIYGISKAHYEYILANPYEAIQNPDFAWMRSIPFFVLLAVQSNGLALSLADSRLKEDHAIVLAAVTQNSNALHEANPKFRKDPTIILKAVIQNGTALEYADDELKKDRNIVLAAVTQNGDALYYADDELKKDRDIVLAAVTQNCNALHATEYQFTNDRAVVLAFVTQDGNLLSYTAFELRKDKAIVSAAVTQNGNALQYADDELKNDKVFILNLLNSLGRGTDNALAVFQHISQTLQEDPDVLEAAGYSY